LLPLNLAASASRASAMRLSAAALAVLGFGMIAPWLGRPIVTGVSLCVKHLPSGVNDKPDSNVRFSGLSIMTVGEPPTSVIA
jgi:hypothetical protein